MAKKSSDQHFKRLFFNHDGMPSFKTCETGKKLPVTSLSKKTSSGNRQLSFSKDQHSVCCECQVGHCHLVTCRRPISLSRQRSVSPIRSQDRFQSPSGVPMKIVTPEEAGASHANPQTGLNVQYQPKMNQGLFKK